jgi:hypothetical protein
MTTLLDTMMIKLGLRLTTNPILNPSQPNSELPNNKNPTPPADDQTPTLSISNPPQNAIPPHVTSLP